MDTAALPGRALHRLADGCLKDSVRLRDHKVYSAEPAVFPAGEERGPEHGVLTLTAVDTEDNSGPFSGHARCDYDRSRDDLKVEACLD